MNHHFHLSSIGNVSGLVALVTGGGAGLGLVIAKGLAANGAQVVYIAGRREEVLKKAAEESEGKLVPLRMDVTDKKSISSVVSLIRSREGRLDILVNNAGMSNGARSKHPDPKPSGQAYGDTLFHNESVTDWQTVMNTNVASIYFVTAACLGLLEEGARSRPGETSCVINISSASAHMNLSFNNFSYGASKSALEYLTKSLATEFARRDIPVRVNAIAPALFYTEARGISREQFSKAVQHVAPGSNMAAIPAKRAGRDEELVSAVMYLASPGGGFTNGTVLMLDGGLTIVNP